MSTFSIGQYQFESQISITPPGVPDYMAIEYDLVGPDKHTVTRVNTYKNGVKVSAETVTLGNILVEILERHARAAGIYRPVSFYVVLTAVEQPFGVPHGTC